MPISVIQRTRAIGFLLSFLVVEIVRTATLRGGGTGVKRLFD